MATILDPFSFTRSHDELRVRKAFWSAFRLRVGAVDGQAFLAASEDVKRTLGVDMLLSVILVEPPFWEVIGSEAYVPPWWIS